MDTDKSHGTERVKPMKREEEAQSRTSLTPQTMTRRSVFVLEYEALVYTRLPNTECDTVQRVGASLNRGAERKEVTTCSCKFSTGIVLGWSEWTV